MQEERKRYRTRNKEGVVSRILLSFLFTIPFLFLSPSGVDAGQTTQVTLSWSPNPESDIAGYIVSYGTASGSYTTSVDVGNISSCSMDGLQPGQTYYFAAKAYNTSKLESGYSNEINYTTPANKGQLKRR